MFNSIFLPDMYISPITSPVYVTPLSETINPYNSPTILTPTLSPTLESYKPSPLTLNLDFSKPVIGFYETIDNDPEVRKKMLNYYYDLIRDDWLLDDLSDILNYFVYRDGKVHLVEYNSKNSDHDDKVAEKKVEYIEKEIFTKYNLMEVMSKFTKNTMTKWVDLPKNNYFFQKAVKDYLIKEIKKRLSK